MTDVTFEPVAASSRAPWVRVAWGTFLGYVLAALVLLPAFALADVTGVYEWRQQPTRRYFALDWPFPHAGPWSVLADVAALVLVLALAAACCSWAVRRETGRPTPAPAVFVCLLVTGYVPLAVYDGLFRLRDAVAFVATVVLVRWRAADSTWRLDRGQTGRLRLGLALAAVVVASYGLTHPLYHASTVTIDGDGRERVAFLLGNGSRAGVSLLGVESGPGPFVRATLHRGSAVAGAHVPARGRVLVELVGSCPAGSGGYITVRWVDVRFRHLGRTRTQAIPLERDFRVTCP